MLCHNTFSTFLFSKLVTAVFQLFHLGGFPRYAITHWCPSFSTFVSAEEVPTCMTAEGQYLYCYMMVTAVIMIEDKLNESGLILCMHMCFLHHRSFAVVFDFVHRIGQCVSIYFSTPLLICCHKHWWCSSLILCFAQTHPFHWYFTSALPRSLLAAYPLCLVRLEIEAPKMIFNSHFISWFAFSYASLLKEVSLFNL